MQHGVNAGLQGSNHPKCGQIRGPGGNFGLTKLLDEALSLLIASPKGVIDCRHGRNHTFHVLGFRLGDGNRPASIIPIATHVTNIDVSYVSGTGRNLVELEVTVSDTGDNALLDLGLDSSGSFSAKWDNQAEWVKIHDFDLLGSIYTMQVYTSDESSNDFIYTEAFPITIGRVFSDQKIKLSDYSVTFKVVGDRTHGLVRPTAEGGFNG